ncbi:hypothetical protein [Trichocoleus sp. FACHB-90]|nr:hypothetical protein [Trichocoleus sp. FACHB-90]
MRLRYTRILSLPDYRMRNYSAIAIIKATSNSDQRRSGLETLGR